MQNLFHTSFTPAESCIEDKHTSFIKAMISFGDMISEWFLFHDLYIGWEHGLEPRTER